jgi:hypothetical protein
MGSHMDLVGSWKLVSFEIEAQATGKRESLMGRNPIGYIMFGADRRMMAVITAEGRRPANTESGRSALLLSMIAYSGLYRIEGDAFITKVDASWNEVWTGTEQVRHYKLEGDRLDITSAWASNSVMPGNPVTRGRITWQRIAT